MHEPASNESTPTESPVAEPPPRPQWNTVTPAAPWCPDEWREHLDAVAPGLFASATASATHEAIGGRVSADGWSLVLGARRGKLHAHRGDHREDAGQLLHFAGGWCAAVADGAGSATYSRIGSALATFVFAHEVREALQHGRASADALEGAMQHAATQVNARQRDFAARAGIALRDLRTTLLVATLHAGRLAAMQVGDGAMTMRHRTGDVSHPYAAATGDFSGEVTHFLPDDGAVDVLLASLTTLPATDIEMVLMASDGVEDPWYPFTRHASTLMTTLATGVDNQTVLPPGVVPSWRASVLHAPDAVHAMMEWLAFEKRGENDDRTLCVAYVDAVRDASVRPS